jgi:hypothetical protein
MMERTSEVRERQSEGGNGSNPALVTASHFIILSCFSLVCFKHQSIAKHVYSPNLASLLLLPGKTCEPIITGKSLATHILAPMF